MPRGNTLPPGRSSARIAHDMLRETCPDDMEIEPRPAPARPPSPWLVLAPPFIILVGVVLVAALHDALGSPLGAAWAAEVWGLAKMAMAPVVASTAFGVYVVRNNERAWREHHRSLPPPPTEPDLRQAGGRRQFRSGPHRSLPQAESWAMMRVDEEDDES